MSSSIVNDLDSFLFSSQAASTSSSLFNQTFSANDPSVNPIFANIEPCSYYNCITSRLLFTHTKLMTS